MTSSRLDVRWLLVLLPVPGGRFDQAAGELPCDSIEVVPGVNAIDTEQLTASLTRHFAALNRLCESITLPEHRAEEISEGVISLIRNASIERLEEEGYE